MDIRNFFQKKDPRPGSAGNSSSKRVKDDEPTTSPYFPASKRSRRSDVKPAADAVLVIDSDEDKSVEVDPKAFFGGSRIRRSKKVPSATDLTDANEETEIHTAEPKPATEIAETPMTPPARQTNSTAAVAVPKAETKKRRLPFNKSPKKSEAIEILDDDEEDIKPIGRSSARKKTRAIINDDDDDVHPVSPKRKDVELTSKEPSDTKRPRVSSTDSAIDSHVTEDGAAEQDKKKFNYAAYIKRQSAGPKAPGSKQIPEGAPNCLANMAFVFTGELTSISREDAQNLVKRYGGRVTGAPSSRTSYVIVGDEPGESKLKKVQQLRLKTLDEDGFLELIASRPAVEEDNAPTVKKTSAKGKASATKARSASSAGSTDPNHSSGAIPASSAQLWTDKYRPKSYAEVIGNKALIEKLASWLRNWDTYRSNNFKRQGGDEASCFRAVLLSGPPGIGKTTAAHLVARLEDYDALEFNASDTRNKSALDTVFKESTGSHSVTEYFGSDGGTGRGKSKAAHRRKHVLIMDEVDGMSGGDRGGTAELIQLIKKTKVPIICICNDRQSQKVKSLANYCLDLRFRRAAANQVESRIRQIASIEGLELKPNVVAELVASTSGDIRQIINVLSTYRLRGTVMTFDNAREIAAGGKNLTTSVFDVTQKLLGHSGWNSTSFADKLELYFQDYSLIPLMIQDNYIKVKPSIAAHLHGPSSPLNDIETMNLLANAAESISLGDCVEAVLRGTQNWSLMPVHAAISTVRPCFFAHGALGGQVGFPAWLGMNSKQGKNGRLLKEMQMHVKGSTAAVGCTLPELRLSYLPTICERLSGPLATTGSNGIEEVIQLMDEYYINREDFDAVNDLTLPPLSKLVTKIPTNVKAAFTRAYNKVPHPTPLMSSGKPVKKVADVRPDLEDVVEEETMDAEEADESDEEVQGDKLVKVKTTGVAERKGKSEASGKGKAKAGSSRGRSKK
ncbi:hypothetical protein HDU85_003060 [Gaertneriomyces sp. JEL0708]|nr:hypothetical protein HDU85_003060 [Gaertneriomyces sp. JEL0708]